MLQLSSPRSCKDMYSRKTHLEWNLVKSAKIQRLTKEGIVEPGDPAPSNASRMGNTNCLRLLVGETQEQELHASDRSIELLFKYSILQEGASSKG
ncbi:hypothetical protein T11_8418 [Trichinella zimbabwensis]|uniref:Uncharacterized protein n=1 Tax=Trichinella zimbabwensis TaxID=268475 RepID=A0A0V1HQ48_9BILA|nr:hypothetical protein T11_8418 [Trichinella zimbabwensis]